VIYGIISVAINILSVVLVYSIMNRRIKRLLKTASKSQKEIVASMNIAVERNMIAHDSVVMNSGTSLSSLNPEHVKIIENRIERKNIREAIASGI